MKRVWVESSRTANACSLSIEVTMAADIVDEGSSCHVAGCFDGIREWDGAQGAPFNPQPRSKHEIAGDQRDHNPTHYPACRVVTSSDRVQSATESKADRKVRTNIEHGASQVQTQKGS